MQDPEIQGRYTLAAECDSRPGGEDLDLILMEALGGGDGQPGGADGGGGAAGLASQLSMTLGSLQRFMRSLSQ